MRDKSPTKCDAQLPESNFKTRSRGTLVLLFFNVKEKMAYTRT
ncbi:DUF6783 domain-containing protein [Robinsoniella peoriensis]